MKISERREKKKISGCLWNSQMFREKGKPERRRTPGRTGNRWRNHEKDDGADHLGRSGPKCRSWRNFMCCGELMQQMEEDPFGNTCYPELDQRNFYIDGIVDQVHYDGTLYILKETNMRKMIQKGETMPVVSDIRGDFLSGKSPPGGWNIWIISLACRRSSGRETSSGGGVQTYGEKAREKAAVLYINKRGGKGAADEVSLDYGQYYIEFIKKQIRLLNQRPWSAAARISSA